MHYEWLQQDYIYNIDTNYTFKINSTEFPFSQILSRAYTIEDYMFENPDSSIIGLPVIIKLYGSQYNNKKGIIKSFNTQGFHYLNVELEEFSFETKWLPHQLILNQEYKPEKKVKVTKCLEI